MEYVGVYNLLDVLFYLSSVSIFAYDDCDDNDNGVDNVSHTFLNLLSYDPKIRYTPLFGAHAHVSLIAHLISIVT